MDNPQSDNLVNPSESSSSRRDFLHQAAGIAAGIATMTSSVSSR